MALKGNLSAEDSMVGYAFPECYARIAFTRVTKDSTFIYVLWHADEAARQNDKNPVKFWEYEVSNNLIPQVAPTLVSSYEYLKTLPIFAGWIDI
jgi:hypothetical protein